MSDAYQYIDLKYSYVDPNSGILKNLPNLIEEKDLLFFESSAVSKRLEELYSNPIKIIDSSSLLEIHHHLFQDVYEWAGKVRTVNISKDGKPFFEGERFQMGFFYVDSLIIEFAKINPDQKIEIAKQLAIILDNINFLHPFREGNGRAQREFIRTLAFQKGYFLNLNPPDNKNVYDRYMEGTIESNVQLLAELIHELLIEFS
jgi:cell filamentation protein